MISTYTSDINIVMGGLRSREASDIAEHWNIYWAAKFFSNRRQFIRCAQVTVLVAKDLPYRCDLWHL